MNTLALVTPHHRLALDLGQLVLGKTLDLGAKVALGAWDVVQVG